MKSLSRLIGSLTAGAADRQAQAWAPLGRRTAWQDADKIDALKISEHVLPDSADVAFGTRGYSLQALERDGLMRRERVFRATPLDAVTWRYLRTRAGDERLEAAVQAAPAPV
jgi:hypothetical protein